MTKLADVKTGDILAWRRDKINFTSDLLIEFIRAVTRADYGHVAVALRLEGRLFCLEASYPVVKLSLVRPEEEVYHVPTNLDPADGTLDWLFSLIGLKYSIPDAVRAALGLVSQKDDKWQCAEVVLTFLSLCGVDLSNDYTPDDVFKALEARFCVTAGLLER